MNVEQAIQNLLVYVEEQKERDGDAGYLTYRTASNSIKYLDNWVSR